MRPRPPGRSAAAGGRGLHQKHDELAGKLGKQVDGDLLKHNRCTAKPGPELQKKLDADPWLRREYERQVRLQEKGLHSMSVEDFLRGYTRTGKAQSEMRDRFDNMVQKRVDCGELTEAEAKEMKDSRAALHNPDLRGGGMDRSDVMSLGDRSVNSSLPARRGPSGLSQHAAGPWLIPRRGRCCRRLGESAGRS
ncbi:hypothetical protein HJ590_03455 [Naumannella sp. ID2617S]|nr:hypothetical protein [Naumannella sp. ID2617S]